MRGTILYGPRDVRFEDRETPKIIKPTDAIIRISATCVCGSDLWPYRGIQPIAQPTPMGHEYCGIVEDIGSAVTSIKPGQFVIGSFFACDNTCPNCQVGYQSSCQHASSLALRRRRCCACHSPTAPWSPPRMFPRARWCRACWRFPTLWAPDGLLPMRRT